MKTTMEFRERYKAVFRIQKKLSFLLITLKGIASYFDLFFFQYPIAAISEEA
jgi:hypothetical protein